MYNLLQCRCIFVIPKRRKNKITMGALLVEWEGFGVLFGQCDYYYYYDWQF